MGNGNSGGSEPERGPVSSHRHYLQRAPLVPALGSGSRHRQKYTNGIEPSNPQIQIWWQILEDRAVPPVQLVSVSL